MKTAVFAIMIFLTGFTLFAAPVANFPGKITGKSPGWNFEGSKADAEGMSSTASEGYYPDRGGKLFSSPVSLDKPEGESAFYKLSFKAKSPGGSALWGVDFFGADGKPLIADNNDILWHTLLPIPYERCFIAPEKAVSASIYFMSKSGVEAEDVKLEKTDFTTVAKTLDSYIAKMPPVICKSDVKLKDLLPRFAEARTNGKAFRVVMLGDSIVNDTFNSNFSALFKRKFPDSRVEFICSIRGGTGCEYYQVPENFKTFVSDLKPDLLIIGGVSNIARFTKEADAASAMEKVIGMARTLGCEILILSPGKAYDTRPFDADCPNAPLPKLKFDEKTAMKNIAFVQTERELAKRLNVPFFDITNPAYEYLFESRMPYGFFNRDYVHSNIYGKLINGILLCGFLSK